MEMYERHGRCAILGLMLAFLTTAVPARADLILDPNIQILVTVDGQTREVPRGLLVATSKGARLPDVVVNRFGLDVLTLQFFEAEFDPVLTLGAVFTDAGAASSFSILTISPLVPSLPASVSYKLDLSGSWVDGGSDAGSLTPAITTFGTMDASLNGVAIDGIGGAAAFLPAGGAAVYGPLTTSGTYGGGAPPYTTFGIQFGFTGSGGDDVYGLTGRFEVNPVPEPTTLVLLGSGLLGAVGLKRARRKK
jgi:hypothetical protein